MASNLTETQQSFSRLISVRSFLRGLTFAGAAYALIAGFIIIRSDSVIESLEVNLATQTAKIERAFEYEPIEETAEVAESPVYPRGEHAPPQSEALQQAEQHSTLAQEQPAHAEEAATEITVALRPAPMPELIEDSPQGKLPRIGDTGITPFKAYKKPYTLPRGPMISIAVLGYGLSEQASQEAIDLLPPEVSFILSPYSDKVEHWQKQARAHGHEVWLQLPIETRRYPVDDPGPKALLSNAGLQTNQNALDWTLSRTTGYAGIAAVTDNAFENTVNMLQSLLKGAFGRGLGYFEINPKAEPTIETMALTDNVPYARNTFYLDEISLRDLERHAREQGHVIGVLRPNPKSVRSLNTWLQTLAAKNLTLAPVSAIADSVQVEAVVPPPPAEPAHHE